MMMKIGKRCISYVSLIVLFLSIALPSADASVVSRANKDATVWICGGPNSQRYHSNRGCSGLKRCSKTPSKISLKEAQKRGYTPCKKCY